MSSIVHPFHSGQAQRTTFGYITQDHPKLDRFQNRISAVCGIFSAACVLAIALLTLLEVVTRTIFSQPLGWNISFIESYLMTCAAYFGIVFAYRSGAHVAVAGLFTYVPLRAQKLLLILGYVAVLVGLVFLGWSGLSSAIFSFVGGEQPLPGAADVGLPTWTWKAGTVLAMVLGAILVAIDLYRELAAPWDRTVTDYEPGDAIEQELEAVLGEDFDGSAASSTTSPDTASGARPDSSTDAGPADPATGKGN